MNANTIIRDWMSPVTFTIKRNQTVREALDLLGTHKISAIPVVGQDSVPVGIVTMGDFMRVVDETDRVLESSFPHFDDCLWAVDLVQRRLGSDKVYSLMSELLATASPDESMSKAAALMCESNLHHLLVCESSGVLAGVLSSSDFVRFVSEVSKP